ncbi:MAG: inositol monophosphatase family protein [Elainellaceae cyanobacterium]
MSNPVEHPLDLFLEVATEAAQAAGEVLKKFAGSLSDIQEKGRSGDLVTEADRASEDVVLEVLRRQLPEHAILAEESGSLGCSENTPYLWAIDPLDGTTNYTHGYPFYAVSIGLLIDGMPSVGVVFNPALDELFQAATGRGATCNQKPISVSTAADLKDSLLVTGFAYDRRETIDTNYAEFCHLTHLTQGVRRGGSASVDLAYVACGRLDGYWERGLSPWDIAAGVVLVREAGGRVTAYDQGPLDLDSGRLLATNGALHATLSQKLVSIKPLQEFSPA